VAAVKRATNATLYAHPAESVMRREVRSIATMYGIPAGDFEPCPEPEVALVGGEELSVGGVPFAVRFTPGHSPGHLSFYSSMLGVVIGGDTLFQGGIGRTDLPGGNHEQLLSSIVRELLSLPDPTRVLSGHGPETTIGEERVYNPFLHDGILEQS
jgi:glyoxylase-like metal-dependent hydrolase (beta-lactamase superfamily II)